MKKRLFYKLTIVILLIIVLILEILPNGAVLNFSTEQGELIRKTYSYFSLTPFGYANFGPFLTSIGTVLLILLMLLYLLKENSLILKNVRIVLVATFIFSLLPLIQDIKCFSVTGIFISLILATEILILFVFKEKLKVQ